MGERSPNPMPKEATKFPHDLSPFRKSKMVLMPIVAELKPSVVGRRSAVDVFVELIEIVDGVAGKRRQANKNRGG